MDAIYNSMGTRVPGMFKKGGAAPKGYHFMPDGTLMKDSDHKELGGAVGKDCVSQGPGKPKKCKAGQKRRNFDPKRTVGNIAKGIGAAAGATAVALGAKFVKDNKKKGGEARFTNTGVRIPGMIKKK
jgi:hypothetical protein